MIEKLTKSIETAAQATGIKNPRINLEHPDDISHGDFSSNVALMYSKELKVSPKVLAEKIVEALKKNLPNFVKSVEIAGPGFINFKLKDEVFVKEVLEIDEDFGKNVHDKKKKIMVEYTDPNPFKVFHVGHLMSNAIGESISRLIEFSQAQIKRASWQGDVGLHVAKAIWGAMSLQKQGERVRGVEFWGKAYSHGSEKYDSDPLIKKEIDIINKKVYDRSDAEINKLYDQGRKESLESFEEIYKRLDTKFDNYFFEGKEGREGEAIVREFLEEGIFEESQGAIIFPGEKHGVHTRVFITSQGLPTYETKELGLNIEKFKIYPDLSESIVITANEQSDYFKVLLKVFSLIRPEIANKTRHISHGMMRFASGKMSSRTGNVISAEEMIAEAKRLVQEKIKDRGMLREENEQISEEVGIAAIKYQILRQAIGGDIIYDSEKSVSFEGDSGPYLQYACVRAGTILAKTKEAGIPAKVKVLPQTVTTLEKMLVRFPEVVERSRLEYAPHHLTTYLTELAAEFNSYYAHNLIIDPKNPESSYRVALTKSFVEVMKNGLWLLGIKVPKRM